MIHPKGNLSKTRCGRGVLASSWLPHTLCELFFRLSQEYTITYESYKKIPLLSLESYDYGSRKRPIFYMAQLCYSTPFARTQARPFRYKPFPVKCPAAEEFVTVTPTSPSTHWTSQLRPKLRLILLTLLLHVGNGLFPAAVASWEQYEKKLLKNRVKLPTFRLCMHGSCLTMFFKILKMDGSHDSLIYSQFAEDLTVIV